MVLNFWKRVFFAYVRFLTLAVLLFALGYNPQIVVTAQSSPASATTNADLSIAGLKNMDQASLGFQIDPDFVTLDDNINLSLGPVLDSDGNIITDWPCKITINLSSDDVIVFEGNLDQNGICSYSSNDITTHSKYSITGKKGYINGVIGTHTGFAEVLYGGNTYISNIDEYRVVPPPYGGVNILAKGLEVTKGARSQVQLKVSNISRSPLYDVTAVADLGVNRIADFDCSDIRSGSLGDDDDLQIIATLFGGGPKAYAQEFDFTCKESVVSITVKRIDPGQEKNYILTILPLESGSLSIRAKLLSSDGKTLADSKISSLEIGEATTSNVFTDLLDSDFQDKVDDSLGLIGLLWTTLFGGFAGFLVILAIARIREKDDQRRTKDKKKAVSKTKIGTKPPKSNIFLLGLLITNLLYSPLSLPAIAQQIGTIRHIPIENIAIEPLGSTLEEHGQEDLEISLRDFSPIQNGQECEFEIYQKDTLTGDYELTTTYTAIYRAERCQVVFPKAEQEVDEIQISMRVKSQQGIEYGSDVFYIFGIREGVEIVDPNVYELPRELQNEPELNIYVDKKEINVGDRVQTQFEITNQNKFVIKDLEYQSSIADQVAVIKCDTFEFVENRLKGETVFSLTPQVYAQESQLQQTGNTAECDQDDTQFNINIASIKPNETTRLNFFIDATKDGELSFDILSNLDQNRISKRTDVVTVIKPKGDGNSFQDILQWVAIAIFISLVATGILIVYLYNKKTKQEEEERQEKIKKAMQQRQQINPSQSHFNQFPNWPPKK